MELKDVVAISGMSGLHHVTGRSKNGLIVETIGTGRKFATGFTAIFQFHGFSPNSS